MATVPVAFAIVETDGRALDAPQSPACALGSNAVLMARALLLMAFVSAEMAIPVLHAQLLRIHALPSIAVLTEAAAMEFVYAVMAGLARVVLQSPACAMVFSAVRMARALLLMAFVSAEMDILARRARFHRQHLVLQHLRLSLLYLHAQNLVALMAKPAAPMAMFVMILSMDN